VAPIVNFTSTILLLNYRAIRPYTAAKAGIVGLTKGSPRAWPDEFAFKHRTGLG